MAPAGANIAATVPALPEDVLVEILLLLPAKLVLRFGAVCKQWRRLLSDPIFIHDHHRRAPRAILLNSNRMGISALPFPYTDQSTPAPLYCGIPCQHTYLHGCCDGLLLFSCNCLEPHEIHANGVVFRYLVCNPATREFTRLPADIG
jgi:hypothetical protein